jgi:hypothetical protein
MPQYVAKVLDFRNAAWLLETAVIYTLRIEAGSGERLLGLLQGVAPIRVRPDTGSRYLGNRP